MNHTGSGEELRIYSTCPQSKDFGRDDYIRRVIEVARWSEQTGCAGILVYTDNGLVDPWLVSQIIVQNTETLLPLVAIQPVYLHPYAAAKMVASFGHLYRRRIALNMLAGGFKNDLAALNDTTPHDDRYARTIEYTLIIKKLLQGDGAVAFEGKYYAVKSLKMTPPLERDLFPEIFISGSSAAGRAAAEALAAVAVMYPPPPDRENGDLSLPDNCGVRIGIIARERRADAWRVARQRFPQNRKGEIAHQLAMRVSDSVWHKRLSTAEMEPSDEGNPYWLGPFQRYQTFCPYYVGDYDRIAAEISRYIAGGCRVFILDIPPARDELEHAAIVFERASRLSRRIGPPRSAPPAIGPQRPH